jgi:formylglycine-generating enzyme required for sulfatase activity
MNGEKDDGWWARMEETQRSAKYAHLCYLLAVALGGQLILVSSVSAQSKTKVNPRDGLTYVWIPPGTFQMGCSPDDSDCGDDESPAHSVTLTKGFWIGQTLVTQAGYKKVVGSNPSEHKGDQLPVEGVSWDDAQAYCKGVGMRLPTEAEWEYAARGGSPAARYTPLVRVARYSGNTSDRPSVIGQKQPNGYGLYDMLMTGGDVWQWVSDWYDENYYQRSPSKDPVGPTSGQFHVLRGVYLGGHPGGIAQSHRGANILLLRGQPVGFRCAREVDIPY